MKQLPKITSYGNYSSDNYGVNSLKVVLETITLYYSYETIIAYQDSQDGLIVHQNVWKTTTGKHLNWIDNGNKKSRLDGCKFDEMLQAALDRHIVWFITF